MTSFYPNHLFKDPHLQIQSHLRCWVLGLQYMNLGDTVQPATTPSLTGDL